MKLFKAFALLAVAWATLFASLEAVHIRTHTENRNASVMRQEQSISNTSFELSTRLAKGKLIRSCYPPCLHNTVRFGGNGGEPFDDFEDLEMFGIEKIYVRSGLRVDGIQIIYTGDQPGGIHGGSGGSLKVCQVGEDPIKRVSLRSGHEVDSLSFIKKSGTTCGPYGGSGGESHLLIPPANMVLGAIYGTGGDRIDSIGFYFGRDPDMCNSIAEKSGRWKRLKSFPVPTEYTIQVSVSRTDTVERNKQWSSSVSKSISAGFNFQGIGVTTSVTAEYGEQVAEGYTESLRVTTTTTESYSFPAGTLWQWEFEVIDGCGTTDSKNDLQITDNGLEEPCCPQGLFKHDNDYRHCIDEKVWLNKSHCLQ